MKNIGLREKDRIVLEIIAENYLRIGKPVSSGLIVQKKKLSDSPATIRNIMARLEELGFLSQPHTSAGRIPTDKGLRFYVNSLLDEALYSRDEMALDSEGLFLKKGDLPSLLAHVSGILAEGSDSLGFVLSPRISKINFQHLRFIRIAENKAMVILISTFNIVLTEIVQTDHYFTQLELDKAAQYINQNFRGKNLLSVRDYLLKELPHYRVKYENAINRLLSLLKAYVFHEERESQIFLQGASNLLVKSELFEMEKLKSLFHNFEEKAKLARLLSDFISLDRVKVMIGAEANIPEVTDCSLILSHYGYEDQVLGTLGIIGPKRIPYRKIIFLVNSVAKKLSQTISL